MIESTKENDFLILGLGCNQSRWLQKRKKLRKNFFPPFISRDEFYLLHREKGRNKVGISIWIKISSLSQEIFFLLTQGVKQANRFSEKRALFWKSAVFIKQLLADIIIPK